MDLEFTITMPSEVARRAVDDKGRAVLGRPTFRGGKRGVELVERDEAIIGQPIPLANGRFLVAERFGRHRYHEDAPPLYFALGRQVGRKVALEAARKSKRVVRRVLDAAMRRWSATEDWAEPASGEVGRLIGRIGTTAYYASADESETLAVRTEYDFPAAWYRADVAAAAAAAALAACGAAEAAAYAAAE